MARKCTICEHKKRNEIDSALVRPDAVLRTISHQYGVSIDALKRHVKNGHIIAKIAKAAHAHEALEADDLLGEIKETEEITKTIIDAAMKRQIYDRDGNLKSGDHETALKALARREKQIELKGKVLGAFKDTKQPADSNKPITVKILRGVSMEDL
jgi:hypothetical protein